MSRTQPRMSRGSFFASIALVGATALTLLALAGCGKTDGTAKAQTSAVKPQVAIPFKIGIMTGTVSQGEDEFRAGQMVVAKYGADHVKMVTYPDNFMQEQETVIACPERQRVHAMAILFCAPLPDFSKSLLILARVNRPDHSRVQR